MRTTALITDIVGGAVGIIGAILLVLAAAFGAIARTSRTGDAEALLPAERTLAALRLAQTELERQIGESKGLPHRGASA